MIKRFLAVFLCLAFIASCAGREANTVSVVQTGDFDRDCESLQLEAQSNDAQVKSLITQYAKKKGNNTALTVVGAVVFFPALFALDLKGAEKAEYEALMQRTAHLANVAQQKGCQPPIFVKTLDQFKEEIAAEKRASGNVNVPTEPNANG